MWRNSWYLVTHLEFYWDLIRWNLGEIREKSFPHLTLPLSCSKVLSFATNLNFLFLFATWCCKPLIFQIIWFNKIVCLKYLKSTTWGCKDKMIRTLFEFLNQILCEKFFFIIYLLFNLHLFDLCIILVLISEISNLELSILLSSFSNILSI